MLFSHPMSPQLPAEEETSAATVDTSRDGRRKTKHRIKVPPSTTKPTEVDKKDKKERDQWLLVQVIACFFLLLQSSISDSHNGNYEGWMIKIKGSNLFKVSFFQGDL